MTCTALLAAAMLGGCGGGTQVEFEGKLFEAVGLAGQTQYKEPKVADRSPLLLPPEKRQAELPEPGSRQTAAVTQPENWPVDPDIERQRQLAEAKAKEKRECENWAFENKKASVEDFEKVQNSSSRCKGWLGNIFKSKDTYAEGSPDTVVHIADQERSKKPVPAAPEPPTN